jgi:hypothetical protein
VRSGALGGLIGGGEGAVGGWGRGFGGVVLLGGDAEGAEEGEVVAGEGAAIEGGGGVGVGFRIGFGGLVDFIEADGGFEHEEDVEALLANLADDAGDLIGLADRFVDRFAQFLDKVFDLLIQCHLPILRRAGLTTSRRTCVAARNERLHALGIPSER